jgi:hypothetical protein
VGVDVAAVVALEESALLVKPMQPARVVLAELGCSHQLPVARYIGVQVVAVVPVLGLRRHLVAMVAAVTAETERQEATVKMETTTPAAAAVVAPTMAPATVDRSQAMAATAAQAS